MPGLTGRLKFEMPAMKQVAAAPPKRRQDDHAERDTMRRLLTTGYAYVAVNIGVSMLIFIRNLAFARSLPLADLGQVALLQTIILLVGFAQVGLISGGYLLYARPEPHLKRQLVNMMAFLSAGLMALLAGLAALALTGALRLPEVAPLTLAAGLVAGGLTLVAHWLNNLLIADRKLLQSNAVNLAAITLSLGATVLSVSYGLAAAVAALVLHPLVICIAVLASAPQTRPRFDWPGWSVARRAVRLGLPLFSGMLILLLLNQIERWTITFALGADSLGRFYLVIMYVAFYQLVPMSLLNMRTPQAIGFWRNGDMEGLAHLRRQHLRDVTLYNLAAVVITLSALDPVVALVLPDFTGETHLVLLVMPAMAIMAFQNVPGLDFVARDRLLPFLHSSLAALGVYMMLLAWLGLTGGLSLETVAASRIGAALAGAAVLGIVWMRHRHADRTAPPG
jgi:O-antigen/teichoic acid export membrane protein